jgi:hypothetical protein
LDGSCRSSNWNAGLRFFEKARKSNLVHEIMYPLAKWRRAGWTEILEKGVAFLQHIEDNVPILRQALEETRSDEPFVADLLWAATCGDICDRWRAELRVGALRPIDNRQ